MKVDKYDRQIRIWGSKGQKRLSNSRVALVGCSGSGIEALKNLILPGVGTVDIWDNQPITVSDLSGSFFYEHDSVGKMRGEQAIKNLLEMNPDVSGKFYQSSLEQFLKSQQAVKSYDLIISANLTQKQNRVVSNLCWQLKVPVIFISSVGFFFQVRIQKQIHLVESQNISSKKYYLRLHDPFPDLNKYYESKNLSAIINGLSNVTDEAEREKFETQFGKITYPVFLIESYKQSQTKKSGQIKQRLLQWKQLAGEAFRDGINEAISRSFDLFQTPENFMPDLSILQDELVANVSADSDFIYVFLKAVKVFLERYGHLPQLVRMPDIGTSTKEFLELKSVYKAEHQQNRNKILEIVEELLPGYKVDKELVSEYINNIDALQIIKMRSFESQLQHPDVLTSCLNYLGDERSIYVAMRAIKRFESDNRRSVKLEDTDEVLKIAQKYSLNWSLENVDLRFVKEMCRYEGKSLINISSIAGAVAGQEGVKLLTRCFAPMNSSYLYDGVHCKGYQIAL